MCSMYWTVRTVQRCPKCNRRQRFGMQTHDYGEVMSCVNSYRMREPVAELKGVTAATLDFCDFCQHCDTFIDAVGIVKNGRVVKITVAAAPVEDAT